jgi:hypothetical protein
VTTVELRKKLSELEAQHPGRTLIVAAREKEIGVRIMSGARQESLAPAPGEMGRGVGSLWVKILVPDEG